MPGDGESSGKGRCDAQLMRAIFGVLINIYLDACQNKIISYNRSYAGGERNTASDVLVLVSIIIYLILDVLFQEML